MRKATMLAVTALCALVLGATLQAHHSLAAQFDENTSITLKGVISKVEWYNPHVYLYLDVDEGGTKTTWAFESFPPNTLRRGGLTKDKLGLGQTVTMLGYKARNGSPLAFLRKITFQDGQEIMISLGDIRQVK